MPAISPWLIAAAVASAAASVGGTAASMAANAKIRSKQASQRNAERARQLSLNQQRDAAIEAAKPQYNRESQEQKQNLLAEQLEQYLAPPSEAGADYVAQNPGAPKEVTDSMADRLSGAMTKGRDYAKDLAQVSSYGRLGFGNNLQLNRLGEHMQRLNTESGRSTGILGTELEGAHMAGVGANNMAAILQGVSSLAGAGASYGLLTRAPKVPAGAVAPPTYIQKPS